MQSFAQGAAAATASRAAPAGAVAAAPSRALHAAAHAAASAFALFARALAPAAAQPGHARACLATHDPAAFAAGAQHAASLASHALASRLPYGRAAAPTPRLKS